MKRTFILSFMLIWLTGCVAVEEKMAPEIKLVQQAPVQKHSQYASSLVNLGEFMEDMNEADFAVLTEYIADKTGSGAGKLPQDLTMLVESALQNVGPPLMVMPNGDRSYQYAKASGWKAYNIHGAITEFDAATSSRSSGKQVGFFYKDADLGVEISNDFASGTIAMDFMVLDLDRSVYLPGVKATAKANIVKQSKNRGFSFSIIGNGFGMNGNTHSQTPIHHVVNIMVEYCMIQLVGQLKIVPYWLFIHDSDPDYRLIRKMERKFQKEDEQTQNAICSYILNKINPDVQPSQKEIDSYTALQIISFKRRFNVIPADESVTPELYVKLLTDGIQLIKQQKTASAADAMIDSVLN